MRILLAIVLCVATPLLAGPRDDDELPASKPSAESSWRQVKSASGNVKGSVKQVKFLVSSRQWRVSIRTEVDRRGGAVTGNARVAVLVETLRDTEEKPINWKQIDVITQGKVPQNEVKEFSNGLTKDGKPQWFELQITGNAAMYEITVEDQSPGDVKSKKSKKG